MPPRALDEWQNDAAHTACWQWITAWRNGRRDLARPALRFAEHLGRCATAMAAEGTSKADMARMFAAAGRDAICVCGATPDSVMEAAA